MTVVISLAGPASARREVRRALARAGFDVVAEAESVDEIVTRTGSVVAIAAAADAGEDGANSGETLTGRERDVLELLAEGLSNRGAAERLGISEHTVKFHVASIYGKLGASTRAGAIRRAARRGLISL